MRALARAWFVVSTQSVGGGASTLFMIRRVMVDQQRWITLREFTEAWALCQLSPGIHLVAFAGLLGSRIAGLRGVIVSVAGLMVPAALIAAILTAGFGQIAQHPLTIAALAGVAPVSGGMAIGLALTTAGSVMQRGRLVVVDVAVVAAACVVLLLNARLTIAVILVAAVLGALFLGRKRPTSTDAPVS
jgi:chromate transporter